MKLVETIFIEPHHNCLERKKKMEEKNRISVSRAPVAIALICDDGYVMPTSVAITSLIQSKHAETIYDIYIVCASLSESNENIFKQFESETINIHIIRESAERFANLHTFQEGAFCVATPAALLKFILPELLFDCDRVLYLDGDLLVREDLTELYQTNLGNAYLAAVVDSSTIYYHNEYIDRVENYFNSGVMLMNLAQMRLDNLTQTLIQLKADLKDSNLMDQNIFNCACDKKVITLPIRFNFLPLNLIRAKEKWTLDEINKCYATEYPDETSLFSDAAIIHFSSKDKPWKDQSVVFADDWYRCYLQAPVEHTIVRGCQEKNDAVGTPKVSVIIPIFNVEVYLEETLNSIRNQTLRDIEIICVDDGSTDNTPAILKEYATKDERIRVHHQKNQGQGKARNVGLDLARGTYVYFMDSDDLLDADALEQCYEIAVWNNLDVVLFEGVSFYEDGELEQRFPEYKTCYHRKKYYPYIYSGQDMYVMLSKNWDSIVQPCMKLYRRKYLQDNRIRFPENIRFEDEYFAIHSIICADRTKTLNYSPYHRRVRSNSTMTNQEDLYLKYIGYHETACLLLDYLVAHELNEDTIYCIAFRINYFFESANNYYFKLDSTQQERIKQDPSVRQLDYTLLAPILALHKTYFFTHNNDNLSQQHRKEFKRLREQIQILNKEKRERYEELQKLYKEKGERWQELQALRKEKGERWGELQTLKKEKVVFEKKIKSLEKDKKHKVREIRQLKEENNKLTAKLQEIDDGAIIIKMNRKIVKTLKKIARKFKKVLGIKNKKNSSSS